MKFSICCAVHIKNNWIKLPKILLKNETNSYRSSKSPLAIYNHHCLLGIKMWSNMWNSSIRLNINHCQGRFTLKGVIVNFLLQIKITPPNVKRRKPASDGTRATRWQECTDFYLYIYIYIYRKCGSGYAAISTATTLRHPFQLPHPTWEYNRN